MIFTTSIDARVRKKTIAAFLLFSLVSLNGIQGDHWIFSLSMFAFFMLLLLHTYLHQPLKYELNDKDLIIHRLLGNVIIHVGDIKRVDRINHDLLKDERKGGAFGYFGKFDTFLGKTIWFATRRDKLVLITQNENTKLILSPDNWDGFIDQLDKKVHR